MNILCFIFSWKGQYQNARKIESQLKDVVDIKVINSDDDNTPENWINIGNECYFSDQFRTALMEFDSDKYDAIWHIQADAWYDDFPKILESAKTTFQTTNWGVYAPNVDDTFYIPERTDVAALNDALMVVGTTDNTCWFIHKDIIQTLNENLHLMESNQLGWGWDLLLCGYSHIAKRKVIRDYTYKIYHPSSTGYKIQQAEDEMRIMFGKCPPQLQETIYLIKSNPRNLIKYYSDIVAPKGSGFFVFDTETAIR